jgi:hypothetical protein
MMPSMDNRTLSRIITNRLTDVNIDMLSDADWDFLTNSAQSEGVAPLVYWAFLKAGKLPSLPQGVQKFLRVSYASTWMQNQNMFKELEILSSLFHQADIPIVVLKGVCFALTIYPDVGLRPMGDMDLLVPASKLADAVEISKSLGFMDVYPEASPGLRDLLNHEICLQKTGAQPITLELHHSLVADKTYSYSVPVDWFWEQTEPLDAKNLLMLTPAAQMLYAACHIMLQHGGKNAPLRWFYDLDSLIRHYGERMDWELLLVQAKTFEWSSALDAALSQTVAYFDTPIPDYVRVSLSQLTDRHQRLVALKQTQTATHILEERQNLLSLNWYGRFRLILALVIPSPAYMRWRYQLKNSWMLPAYYPFRWWVILKDAVRTVFSLGVARISEIKKAL